MEKCKSNDSYLIGNDNIMYNSLDATSACINLNNSDQRWIGVVRDQYVKSDQGKPGIYIFLDLNYSHLYCMFKMFFLTSIKNQYRKLQRQGTSVIVLVLTRMLLKIFTTRAFVDPERQIPNSNTLDLCFQKYFETCSLQRIQSRQFL